MPAVAALALSLETAQSLRRALPPDGPWAFARCTGLQQLEQTLQTRLVDAVVFSPVRTPLQELAALRDAFPHVPWIACAPFRPDDGPLLLSCQAARVGLILIEGVDNAVAGDLVLRHSAAAERRRQLAEAPRMLRLTERLQREVWHYLLERVDQSVRTEQLAARFGYSREHLSREFGAGGAPNLKRVIDLTRVACAATLLRNPGYDVSAVARILSFATPSHLSATARRIAGVPTRGLGALGPRGVLAHFARGKTRSRV
ncbi:MAG TPA: AraC family transcriptional regulator [Gemmatimonadales bacterium]|nr:AraC family transcriptional regulator [Gemmatimonadales bacterium]